MALRALRALCAVADRLPVVEVPWHGVYVDKHPKLYQIKQQLPF